MHDLQVNDQTAIAAEFVQAVAAGDRQALRAMLAGNVEFRALTPSRSWAFDTADEVVDTMVGRWFGGERQVEEVESLVTDTIGDIVGVGYRFRATTPDGPATVEQQAYLAIDGGTITGVRLVCSGYQPRRG